MDAGHSLEAAAASEKRPIWRRRHYIVDRGFQLRHTVGLSLISLVISATFGAVMYRVHLENSALLAVTPELMSIVHEADRDTLILIVLSSLGVAVAMVFVGVWVTHKVAGPLWVIAHYVGILGAGRYPVMRPLRKGDQLTEFFTRFSVTVDSLRERDRVEARTLEELASRLSSDPTSVAAELRERAATLRRNAEELVERPHLDELPR